MHHFLFLIFFEAKETGIVLQIVCEVMMKVKCFTIASLLVSYFCRTATPEETLRVDEWIQENDRNMQVFEQCLGVSMKPRQYDPDGQWEWEDGGRS